MAFEMTCPACEDTQQVADDMIGHEVRCRTCGTRLRVPDPNRATTDASEPEESTPRRRRPEADDSDDVPGRHPRRRGSPPRGRGMSVASILAIICGVLFLGCVGCCGGLYLLLPGEKWHHYESADGGFAVDLPAPAKKNLPIPGFKPEPGQKVEGAILWKRGEFYAVMYLDIPPEGQRGVTAEAMLDAAVKEMRSDPESRVVREERIKVSGSPAREIEYLYSDGGTYTGRLVVAERRFFIIIAGGRFVRPGNANVRRFLSSFEISKPARGGG